MEATRLCLGAAIFCLLNGRKGMESVSFMGRCWNTFLTHCFHVTSSLLLMCVLSIGDSEAAEVTGGNATVVLGGDAVLPCKLAGTQERLVQISWQRRTRGKPLTDNFFIISPENGPQFVNGGDKRFEFIGSLSDSSGSLQLSNVTLNDEGTYTCIFTLFPSGNSKTVMLLNVLVPPFTTLKVHHPSLSDEEASLATCTAAVSKPPSEVRWLTGTLGNKVRVKNTSTLHTNGTTTTVSSLFGIPTREIDQYAVQCVVDSAALSKEQTLPFTIQIYFSPAVVNIAKSSKDSFECVTEANPSANFTWSRPGQSLPQSAVKVEGATLQFLKMTSDLNGVYQCEASNPHGSKHGLLYVYVTPGACTVCWTLLGLLLFLIFGGVLAALWNFHKSRTRESRHSKRQTGQTLSRMSDEAQGNEVEAEELHSEAEASQ